MTNIPFPIRPAFPPGTGMRGGLLAAAAFVLLWFSAITAEADMDIQRVTSPGGIEAWLVENHNVPQIAMRFGFVGGSAQDPEGKEGLAYFVSGMLDEGAGELDSVAFQKRMQETAIRMDFDASRDSFVGEFQTLTRNREEGFELLRLALGEPRFDSDAVERIRGQILTSLKFDLNEPRKVASREWFRLAFGDHPYASPLKGTQASVETITREDLQDYVRRVFARDTLKVAVVGDIDAETLAPLLDEVFGGLSEKSDLRPVPETAPPGEGARKVVEMNIPQSVAVFGSEGVKRKDEDFVPAYVMNYILGGGGFGSRLMEEVREKRGLAYGVYTHLSPMRKAAVLIGSVATENEAVNRSLDVIRAELARMAEEGPSAEELENAKKHLTGSYPLRFDASSKIANQLLGIQMEELGIDYVDKRNDLIEAVTLEDVKRVADRLLKPGSLLVTIVGKPSQPEPSGGPAKEG